MINGIKPTQLKVSVEYAEKPLGTDGKYHTHSDISEANFGKRLDFETLKELLKEHEVFFRHIVNREVSIESSDDEISMKLTNMFKFVFTE